MSKSKEIKAIELAILAAVKVAHEECKTFFAVNKQLSREESQRLNRIKKNAANALYFEFAAKLGDNAYIRQVSHGDSHGSTWTTWQVGIFKKVGEYQILTDESKAHVALAKTIHATGAIL